MVEEVRMAGQCLIRNGRAIICLKPLSKPYALVIGKI